MTEEHTPNEQQNQSFQVRMPSGTDDPLSDVEIQQYREEINRLDQLIIDSIKQRSLVSQAIGKTRLNSGGTRLVYSRETAILNNYRRELGVEGIDIAGALLRLGRGRLG